MAISEWCASLASGGVGYLVFQELHCHGSSQFHTWRIKHFPFVSNKNYLPLTLLYTIAYFSIE